MINRRRKRSPLASLPNLAVQIDLAGREPVRGTLVDIREGRVVLDVGSSEQADALAAAGSARITVHAPGVRFEATAAPAGSVDGTTVALLVDPDTKVGPETA